MSPFGLTYMKPQVHRFLKYLEFKLKCAHYQERNPLRLDYLKCLEYISTLEKKQEEKVELLKEVMPRVPVLTTKNKPKRMFKKDGSLGKIGITWLNLLKEHKKPPTFEGPLIFVSKYEEPNPNSPDQVKKWLFSLGWLPCTFDYKKDSEGKDKQVPQVRQNGELTQSVLNLAEDEPSVMHLVGLSVIQHRLSIFKGFVESAIQKEDGFWYVKAEIQGFTNTLRFKHKKPCVNLPGVDKPWGKEIRGVLLAPDGGKLVGADMVSLESTTKRHFIFPFDPDYAKEMSEEGFDEHLDLAVKNKAITLEDYQWYISQEEDNPEDPIRYKRIKVIRKLYKPVNYASVYGVGALKLSRTMGIPIQKAKELIEAYWRRNWSVNRVADALQVKTFGGYDWVQNPLSGFWYQLRFAKDKFSTLNQSAGVYIFDSWLARAAALGYWGNAQFHDETLGGSHDESRTRETLTQAVDTLNRDLTLEVTVGIDMKFGGNYAQVH